MKARLQVMKFGGTSVGDAACIARTAQIIAKAAKGSGCIAVVSAMSGVTNRLIEAAKKEGEVTWYTTQIIDQFARPAAEAFEKKYGVRVQVISVGTGKALKLAENGDVDVTLVVRAPPK